jgi:hypothetical protein
MGLNVDRNLEPKLDDVANHYRLYDQQFTGKTLCHKHLAFHHRIKTTQHPYILSNWYTPDFFFRYSELLYNSVP